MKRKKWPAWVKPILLSRDRGKCANCGANFIELNEQPHIDHIVPLKKGGCNDIVNLQLLCSNCNGKKHDNIQLVKSSIPEYMNWHQPRKTKK
ncbi:MAG: HNH endonuclease [Anaerolineaceae bacterium]|nr:HNH endonuclease [Anaerolineaceae bacterium]